MPPNPCNTTFVPETLMKTYRLLIEYWVPDENENLYEERIIKSYSSCGKITDDYLAQDRTNLIRSVEVSPFYS